MTAFTRAELDWDNTQPGESYIGKLLRGIFASIDICMTESGCPLTDEQRTILREVARR